MRWEEIPKWAKRPALARRNGWARAAVDAVRDGETFQLCSSGNTLVIALDMRGDGQISVYDCRIRREAHIPHKRRGSK